MKTKISVEDIMFIDKLSEYLKTRKVFNSEDIKTVTKLQKKIDNFIIEKLK